MSFSLPSKIVRQLSSISVPVFGTLGVLGLITRNSARAAPLFAPWSFPVVVGGGWFMWYFLDDDTKKGVGLYREHVVYTPTFGGGSAKSVENVKIRAEVAQGNFTALHAKWDAKLEKMCRPGDDDDDDDEEEEEEEENDD